MGVDKRLCRVLTNINPCVVSESDSNLSLGYYPLLSGEVYGVWEVDRDDYREWGLGRILLAGGGGG